MKMQPTAMSGVDRLERRADNHWLEAMVRLKPGVTVSRAQADLDLVARDIGEAYGQSGYGRGVKLSPLWRAPNAGGAAVVGVMGIQQASPQSCC